MRTNFKILVHTLVLKDFHHQKHITATTMLPVYNVHTHNSGHTLIVLIVGMHTHTHIHTHNTEMSHLKHKHDE